MNPTVACDRSQGAVRFPEVGVCFAGAEAERDAGRASATPRAEIIEAAASSVFGQVGYDRASLRAIASEAGVDPSLIHHYFPGGKAACSPRASTSDATPAWSVVEVMTQMGRAAPASCRRRGKGQALVRLPRALGRPRRGRLAGAGSAFATLVQAVSASPAAADALREFLADRIWSHVGDDGAEHPIGPSCAGRLPAHRPRLHPLRAPAGAARLGDARRDRRWIGPTLDRYASGPLDA